MINFDDYTNENIIEHISKWPYIPDRPYQGVHACWKNWKKCIFSKTCWKNWKIYTF